MTTLQERTEPYGLYKRTSFRAIIAGAIIGLVLLILFNMFGAGIGLGALDIREESDPARGLGTASIIWYIITGLIALFAAGWVSGRLAKSEDMFDAALHGLLSWGVITLVSICLVTSALGMFLGSVGTVAGGAIKAAGNVSGKVMDTAAPALKEKADEMDLSDIRRKGVSGEAIEIFKKADGNPDNVSKDDLTSIIMKSSEINRQQASARADSLITQYKEASAKWNAKKEEIKAKALKTADDVAAATSAAFIALFVILISGGFAAAIGARLGLESRSIVYTVSSRKENIKENPIR